jgi:hypothetical protein
VVPPVLRNSHAVSEWQLANQDDVAVNRFVDIFCPERHLRPESILVDIPYNLNIDGDMVLLLG